MQRPGAIESYSACWNHLEAVHKTGTHGRGVETGLG